MKFNLPLILAAGLFSLNIYATEIQEGRDYTTIAKVGYSLPNSDSKITVTEFFSFACGACSNLSPLMYDLAQKNKNIDLKTIQVVWGDSFKGYAKINASIEILNLDNKFKQNVFEATLRQRKNLEDPKQLNEFLLENKNIIDPKKFMEIYNSFAVVSVKANEYAKYTSSYNITATPSIIVDGKYLVKPAQPIKLIEVVEALVEKELATRSKSKPKSNPTTVSKTDIKKAS